MAPKGVINILRPLSAQENLHNFNNFQNLELYNLRDFVWYFSSNSRVSYVIEFTLYRPWINPWIRIWRFLAGSRILVYTLIVGHLSMSLNMIEFSI